MELNQKIIVLSHAQGQSVQLTEHVQIVDIAFPFTISILDCRNQMSHHCLRMVIGQGSFFPRVNAQLPVNGIGPVAGKSF